MPRPLAYAIAILFAVYFPAATWLQAAYVDPAPKGKIVLMLGRPFENLGTFAAVANQWLPPGQTLDGADNAANPQQSPVLLYEDDRLLGPAHSVHGEIMTAGNGLYSHWQGQMVFSASDNSDPNTNGRRYWAVVPWPREPQVSRAP